MMYITFQMIDHTYTATAMLGKWDAIECWISSNISRIENVVVVENVTESQCQEYFRAIEITIEHYKTIGVQKEWYGVAWGNGNIFHNHTQFHQKRIETVLGRQINSDIDIDEDGHVLASTVLSLTASEVQKLRDMDWIWHVEPVAEPSKS